MNKLLIFSCLFFWLLFAKDIECQEIFVKKAYLSPVEISDFIEKGDMIKALQNQLMMEDANPVQKLFYFETKSICGILQMREDRSKSESITSSALIDISIANRQQGKLVSIEKKTFHIEDGLASKLARAISYHILTTCNAHTKAEHSFSECFFFFADNNGSGFCRDVFRASSLATTISSLLEFVKNLPSDKNTASAQERLSNQLRPLDAEFQNFLKHGVRVDIKWSGDMDEDLTREDKMMDFSKIFDGQGNFQR